MARFIYLLVNLDDGTVQGTDDAELLQPYVHDEGYTIIVTTGPTQSFLIEGDGQNVKQLPGGIEDQDFQDSE